MFRIAAAAITIVLLTGCTPTSAPEPVTSSTPTGAVASTPTAITTPGANDSASTVATVVLRAQSLQALNADGDVVSTVLVSETPDSVVATLTGVFGTEPKSSSQAPYRYYDWEGFRLTTRTVTMDGAPTELHPGIGFIATAPSAYGIAITTVHGITVGDSASDVDADYPKAAVVLCDCDEKHFRFDEVTIDTSDAGYAQQQYVLVTATSAGGNVISIGSPANNYDA